MRFSRVPLRTQFVGQMVVLALTLPIVFFLLLMYQYSSVTLPGQTIMKDQVGQEPGLELGCFAGGPHERTCQSTTVGQHDEHADTGRFLGMRNH